ncbi:MAG: SpoIIIAH-like family protein [Lachnospiraceae bacterium]|nr:SpoIIIAH-like family protein [Lachnospiraceae bacterium]
MKKLFRRNQIIITTLAIMIAAAGYLNYAGKKELEASSDDMVYEAGLMEISDEDLLRENQAAGYAGEIEEAESLAGEEYPVSADGQTETGGYIAGEQYAEIDSWDEGEAAGMENPGEAVLTSGMTVSDYIANVQLNREQIRAKNKETLNNIINNTNIEEAAKQEAIQNMIAMTAVAEKENAAETLLQAKGFSDPVVSLTDGKVDVVINATTITDQQRAQIEDIVKRKTEVSADGIVITLLNLQE